MDQYDLPPFSRSFLQAFRDMQRSGYSERMMTKFVDFFGTHYLTSIHLGARYLDIKTYDKDTILNHYESAHELNAGVDNLVAEASAGVNTSSAEDNMWVDKSIAGIGFTWSNCRREHLATSRQIYSLGSRPPSDGKATTWAQSVTGNPLPIHIKLNSILSLINEKNFAGTGIDHRLAFNKLNEFYKVCEMCSSESALIVRSYMFYRDMTIPQMTILRMQDGAPFSKLLRIRRHKKFTNWQFSDFHKEAFLSTALRTKLPNQGSNVRSHRQS